MQRVRGTPGYVQALARFEAACKEFRALRLSEREKWRVGLMPVALDELFNTLGKDDCQFPSICNRLGWDRENNEIRLREWDPGEQRVYEWQRVGSTRKALRAFTKEQLIMRDAAVLRGLVRLHYRRQEQLNECSSEDAHEQAEKVRTISTMIGCFLLGYYYVHPWHVGNESLHDCNFDVGISLEPIQNAALTVLYEAFETDDEFFQELEEWKSIGLIERQFDKRSRPIEHIITRTWSSGGLVKMFYGKYVGPLHV